MNEFLLVLIITVHRSCTVSEMQKSQILMPHRVLMTFCR